MATQSTAVRGSEIIQHWPEESREAAEIVINTYGEPHEATESQLIWHNVGQWKRMIATKTFHHHHFPIPHIDSVESVIDYWVPPETATELAQFDGSVTIERTAGELSARCHDEQANFLALNLVNDIVTGSKTVGQARQYYAKEFLDVRRNKPTPYMDGLKFTLANRTTDPDEPVLTDADLRQATEQGQSGG